MITYKQKYMKKIGNHALSDNIKVCSRLRGNTTSTKCSIIDNSLKVRLKKKKKIYNHKSGKRKYSMRAVFI